MRSHFGHNMSINNLEKLVKLERALEVQLSAKKFYSGISELDVEQRQHLADIEKNIERLCEYRDGFWTMKKTNSEYVSPNFDNFLEKLDSPAGTLNTGQVYPQILPLSYEISAIGTMPHHRTLPESKKTLGKPIPKFAANSKPKRKRLLILVGLFLVAIGFLTIILVFTVGKRASVPSSSTEGLPSSSEIYHPPSTGDLPEDEDLEDIHESTEDGISNTEPTKTKSPRTRKTRRRTRTRPNGPRATDVNTN